MSMLARLETEETEVRPVMDLVDLPVAMVVHQPTILPDDSLVQPDESLEYEIPLDLRPRAAARAPRKRGWGRTIVVLALLALIAGGIFAVMGGAGAVLVAGGAVAGWLLYTVPVIDIQLPPPAQGESDADLIVMPDPGFRPQDPKPEKPLKAKLP
jgi:hypothetical protein